MNTQLRSSFSSQFNGEESLWINYLDYAKRLFASNESELWNHSSVFVSMFSQAQNLLKSNVLSVNVQDFYSAYISENPDQLAQWTGKKPTFILKKLLSFDQPKTILIEVLNGLNNLYGDQYPIVLMVPSPQKWMIWLKEQLNLESKLTSDE
ncbi:hypothetical protein V7157_21880, partial [Neobacillus drentensis]|uniref:hypothetical protein n=1 Tax=Neobacillus drentensis TaxID=220684 RepID=UPI00300340AC